MKEDLMETAKEIRYPGLNVPLRLDLNDLIEAASDPKAATRLLEKHKMTREQLAKEIERLSKILAIQAGDMICV
jgi:hypothetical protein